MTLQKVLLSAVLCLVFPFAAFAGPVTGTINGKAFTFVAGSASIQGNDVHVNLWTAAQANACDGFSTSTLNARAIFPAKVGTYPVVNGSFSENVMIFGDNTTPGDPSNNIMADHGTFEVTAISDTALTGTISGGLGFMNTEVSGEFSVPLCK